MSVAHYILDRYFPDPTAFDGFRRESSVIKAANETDAIAEAKRFGPSKKSVFFKLREVGHNNEREIYDSRADNA